MSEVKEAANAAQQEEQDVMNEDPKQQQSPADADQPTAGADDASTNRLQSELERFRDLAMRAQADFDNYRKRAAREKDEAIKFANANLLERLLPVIDNFELGLQAAKQSAGDSPVLEGIEMIYKQLQDFLNQAGVEVVPAEGQVFDPNLHDAVAQEASDEVPEGHVLRQLRKGYKLRERLLRASMVVVSKGPAKG